MKKYDAELAKKTGNEYFTLEDVLTIAECVKERARQEFNWFPWPEVDITLRGKCAGRAIGGKPRCRVRINPISRSFDDLVNTMIHEIGHVIDYCFNGKMDHGAEWKSIVVKLGGRADRCHSMSLPAAYERKITVRWFFECDCRKFSGEGVRYNRMAKRPDKYRCIKCGSEIRVVDSFRL